MAFPVDITFRDMAPSEAVERRVREWAEKIDSHPRAPVLGCEVVLEQPHHHHRQGNRFHVRVSLKVPGEDLHVTRDPGDDNAHEDPYVAIHDAFRTMRRRYDEYVRRLTDIHAGERVTPG